MTQILKHMVHTINNNTRENLKNELRNDFPNLTDTDLNSMDESFEKLVANISLKINRDEKVVAEVVKEKLEYIYSKSI